MNNLFYRYARFLIVFFLIGCNSGSVQLLNGQTMGTTYTVKIITNNDLESLHEKIKFELKRINTIMSTYIKSSELSLLNKSPVGNSIQISEDLTELLSLSHDIYKLTDGAFDVTVGPLVNLWGFGPEGDARDIPTPKEIAQQMQRIGFNQLQLEGQTAYRMDDIYIDLSGIAKGFAVDRVAALIKEHSYADYLVEIGGELKVGGNNGEGKPWSIAIEKPEVLQRSIFRTLPLNNLGIATSGDYRNYREINGQRYSHLIDPRTGMPITHQLVSVTVLNPSTAFADGLATGLSVLNYKEAMKIAVEQKYAVLFIIKVDSGFSEQRSPELEKYLADLKKK
ncbi:MAG: FAD:protein FMN transferase [Candidatus Azotimanducaceae bacterium]|uniref:FAD:protein FMN transferase n=1 Tax=OM182 bacterium TaxID=2510334 RepID=A0A520S0B1_9GAMM|nr:hypothetical protein [Gammaproteobacteria bacterium]RZO75903.1 MAG: FAD:protein FMN transferase [OM182 bacterium]